MKQNRSHIPCKCSYQPNRWENVIAFIKRAMPGISGILLAILPKCPLCIVAYSGAITLCGGTEYYYASYPWLAYGIAALCLLVLLMVAANFKGKITIMALLLVAVGSYLILSGIFIDSDLNMYSWGSSLILAGALTNGSFSHWIRRLLPPLRQPAVSEKISEE